MSILNLDINPGFLLSSSAIDVVGKATTQVELNAFAKELERAVREEFIAGDHNQTGETLDSIKVRLGPMGFELNMAGGGYFVESGTPPHMIETVDAQALHWFPSKDWAEGYAQPGIFVSGYEGDPFIERAIDDVHWEAGLDIIAERVFAALVRSARGMTFSSIYPLTGEQSAMEAALSAQMDRSLPIEEESITKQMNEEFPA